MQLTVEQRVFVVSLYIETKSYTAVVQAFRERFPERNPPTRRTVYENVRKYRNHGTSLNRNKNNSGRRISIRTQENIESVRDLLIENPTLSTRRNESGLSQTSFSRIVRDDLKWHPYRIHVRHGLKEHDYQRRIEFCTWFFNQSYNPRFLFNFVVGDEASFALNGRVNTHNVRMYAEKGNPPSFNYDTSSNRNKLNVWAGICGNGTLVGPFFFDGNVNGERYLNLINNFVLPQLLRVYNGDIERIWWAQDGATAHRTRAVRDRLIELFRRNVISLGHDIEWPARSPDLTPLDFFLWGYLKGKVYMTPPNNLEELRIRIERACASLRQTNFLQNSIREMRRRANLCIQRNGHHVEGVHL